MKLRLIKELPPKVIDKLREIISSHGCTDSQGIRSINRSSADRRGSLIISVYRVIYSYEYELEKPENIKQKHLKCWIKHHLASGTKRKTILQYCSHLKVFLGWIGKNELLRYPGDLIDGVVSGRRNRTKPRKRLLITLNAIVAEHNNRHSNRRKNTGESTRAQRKRSNPDVLPSLIFPP